jgi:hypothetical protein
MCQKCCRIYVLRLLYFEAICFRYKKGSVAHNILSKLLRPYASTVVTSEFSGKIFGIPGRDVLNVLFQLPRHKRILSSLDVAGHCEANAIGSEPLIHLPRNVGLLHCCVSRP